MIFQKDITEVFSGTVEVDETYIGSQGKTKDVVQKQMAVSVVEERPRRLYLVFYALVEKYGQEMFLMLKQRHNCLDLTMG